MKSETYAICGCPRSGTTWLHNTLIKSGGFRGVIANDNVLAPEGLFFTDENRYSHTLLFNQLRHENCAIYRNIDRVKLAALLRILKYRFGSGGNLMLKSPYYCFFAKSMQELGFADKFIFIRRSIDAVSLSMMKHIYISKQLSGEIDFFSMATGDINFETTAIPIEVLNFFRDDQENLSTFDKAMFKCLCFITSFASQVRGFDRQIVHIIDYDLLSDPDYKRNCFDFLPITHQQRAFVASSFLGGSSAATVLPKHNREFRAIILEAEQSVWNAWGEF